MRVAERMIPQVLMRLYPSLVWRIKRGSPPAVYLTFDDGPNPQVTPAVLDTLAAFDAKATFFCLGKNVEDYPEIYQRILSEGHAVGNHTYSHCSGWKTSVEAYVADVNRAAGHIRSTMFRPPYGRITRAQQERLIQDGYTIVMWDVLGKDYKGEAMASILPERVLGGVVDGSLVVLHDSKKAAPALLPALPRLLTGLKQRGFSLNALSSGLLAHQGDKQA